MTERTDEMSEIKLKGIKIVDYICDKCHAGKVKHNGIMLTSIPPQYPHECPYCHTVINLDHVYPRTVLVIE